jgi:aminomethyltransferase
MPIPTPVHASTSTLCTSMRWKDWAGYYAVCSFDTNHDREYFAIRHAAALIDVSPLFKYEITGPDAAKFLARVTVKDITKLKIGQITYCCWCDDDGKVVDDGTITRISDSHFRLTAAEPSLAWFERYKRGYDIAMEDSTTRFAALSLQGPKSRDLLKAITEGINFDELKYFYMATGNIAGIDVSVSRTGYTGDLGYEVWIENKGDSAAKVYDTILTKGEPFSVKACGLDAMDVSRIEAGFIMNGVDYFSAHHCIIDARKSSPYELGLGWCVNLDRESFIGQEALKKEKAKGSAYTLVGLDIDWDDIEQEFGKYDLPPEICNKAWRDGRPVYNFSGEFIGKATSGAWSPMLKKNMALASVKTGYAKAGNILKFEITVEYQRKLVRATVVELPYFNPKRKKA